MDNETQRPLLLALTKFKIKRNRITTKDLKIKDISKTIL
jgi:hypothetical protein